VLGFLDAEDLSAVGLVCKRFFLITDESRYPQPLFVSTVAFVCVVGSFSVIIFSIESLWKKAYGELVPQQFALSQCDDYKAECKKWLRLHLSSEWCATSDSLLSVHLLGPRPHIHLSLSLSTHRRHRYREARKEGRWRFDCPRNDEDWVYDRFFRVALVGDVGTGKVPCVDTLI
jgi:hypothetical protein